MEQRPLFGVPVYAERNEAVKPWDNGRVWPLSGGITAAFGGLLYTERISSGKFKRHAS